MNPTDPCAHCDCPRSAHCRGDVKHGNYKEEARMVPAAWRRQSVTCRTRHCLTPICDCVDFVEPEGLKEVSMERDPPLTERERRPAGAQLTEGEMLPGESPDEEDDEDDLPI